MLQSLYVERGASRALWLFGGVLRRTCHVSLAKSSRSSSYSSPPSRHGLGSPRCHNYHPATESAHDHLATDIKCRDQPCVNAFLHLLWAFDTSRPCRGNATSIAHLAIKCLTLCHKSKQVPDGKEPSVRTDGARPRLISRCNFTPELRTDTSTQADSRCQDTTARRSATQR